MAARGMGSPTQLTPAKVEGIGGRADPARGRRSPGALTREAEADNADALMLSVAVERWLAEVGERFTKQTSSQHRAAVELFARSSHGPIPVGAVTRKMVGTFVSEVLVASGRQQATVNRIISSLSALWRWLVKRGFVEANPWVGQGTFSKRPIRGQRPKRPYTKEELLGLLGADPTRLVGRRYGAALADLMRLGLLTGARLNELCELGVRDVLVAEQRSASGRGKRRTLAASSRSTHWFGHFC